MRRKDTSLAVNADVYDFIGGDGYAHYIFGTVGTPFPTLELAAAAWEKTFRRLAWEQWAVDVLNPRGGRGPELSPPIGAVTHDGLTERADRDYWPQRDTDPACCIAACDADLESVESFRRSRPDVAASVTGPVDLFVAQLLWYRSAALRAGFDYVAGTALVYGPPRVDEGDDDA